MKLLYFLLAVVLDFIPLQQTSAAGSNFGDTYWHDRLDTQPNSVTGAHRRSSRRTQLQQPAMPVSRQQDLPQGLYPPEGYYQQSSEGYDEYPQGYSGHLSHFGSEIEDEAQQQRHGAYEAQQGMADDDLSSAHSMKQERRRRKDKAKETLRRQQMSEVGGGEEEDFDAASQLSLAHLSLAGHVGSGSDASSLHTHKSQSEFDFSGSSTSRASRRKGKAAVGLNEPQTARLASSQGAAQRTPAALAQDENAVQDRINDPRFVQLFHKAWARHQLGYQLQPSQVAGHIMAIGHELRSPAAVEVLALRKIDVEAPVDERDFRGVYRKWIDYYKQMEARGGPSPTQQQTGRGAGGTGTQQHTGSRENEYGREQDDEGTQMVPEYAALSSNDRRNAKEASAVFSVFMMHRIWNENPDVDPKDLPMETIEHLSWGLEVGDFDKGKTESLIRFYLERGLGKSEDELARFDSLRYATRRAWKAQVRAMKEERIAKALRSSRQS